LYFAFQILLDGAALQLHTIQDSSTSERYMLFLLASVGA
jgi:hypothetical protein